MYMQDIVSLGAITKIHDCGVNIQPFYVNHLFTLCGLQWPLMILVVKFTSGGNLSIHAQIVYIVLLMCGLW